MTRIRQEADCHYGVIAGEIATWKPNHFGRACGGGNWCASGESLTAMKPDAGGCLVLWTMSMLCWLGSKAWHFQGSCH